MAERAVLFTLDAATGQAEWLRGAVVRRGSLADLAACGAEAWVWLVDARQVQLAEVELPVASRRVQAQALPYALEDQVLTPVDELSFAVHRLSPTRQACAIFATNALDTALDALAAAGIAVSQAVPDVLCVPWQESTWTLMFAGDAGWLRTGPFAGQRFHAADWRPFIEQALPAIDGEKRVRVFGADDSLLAQIAAVSPALTLDAQATRETLVQCADGYAQGHVIDLLPALPHRQRSDNGRRQRWWWASAALLLVAAVAHAGFMGWHTGALERELATAQADTLASFRAMFPHISRVEDVRVQATQALAAQAATRELGAPFLDLLAAAGQGLMNSPADGLQLESASYGNGALEMRVRANDMTALERYQQSLAGAQIPVQLLSVETRDDKAVGLLRVGQVR
jgi:general secretion pathway protein L